MSTSCRNGVSIRIDAGIMPGNKRKNIPYEFVLDAITSLSPYTRPMFGCLAVYVGDKIVLILRDKPTSTRDYGVWLATTREHHESLRREFPHMRSIQVLGKPVTGWQVLPADARTSNRRQSAHANWFLPGILGSAKCQEHVGRDLRLKQQENYRNRLMTRRALRKAI